MNRTQSGRMQTWVESIVLWRLWIYLAWQDTKSRYSRTKLGPYWTTISLAIWTVSMGTVYAVLFKVPIREFLPYLATGLISWNYISAVLLQSPTSFVEARAALLNIKVPLPALVLRVLVRNLIAYAHSFPVVIAVVLILSPQLYSGTALLCLVQIPIALVVVSICLIPVGYLISALCTKLPDMGQVVASLVQVLFFITPILWPISTLESAKWIYEFNPLYFLTTTLREPLMGNWVGWEIWAADAVLAVIGLTAAIILAPRINRMVPKWL